MENEIYLIINVITNAIILVFIECWIKYNSSKTKRSFKPHVQAFLKNVDLQPNTTFLKAYFAFYMFSCFNMLLSFILFFVNQ